MKKIASIVAFVIFGLAGAANAAAAGNCSTRYMPPLREPQLIHSFTKQDPRNGAWLDGYVNDMADSIQDGELHIVVAGKGAGIVDVSASAKPVTLVLVGGEPGIWAVEPAPGARIAKVLLVGPNQNVIGLPSDITIGKLDRCVERALDWQASDQRGQYMRDDYKRFLRRIQGVTGLTEASFQGGGSADVAFAVPPKMTTFPSSAAIAKPGEPRGEKVWDPKVILAQYEAIVPQIPPEQRQPVATLVELMKRGTFPILLPDTMPRSEWTAPVGLFPMPFTEPHQMEQVTASTKCDRPGGWLRAGSEGDTTSCARGDIFYVSGAGSHRFRDAWGIDVVAAGPGNTSLDLGWGSDVVVLDVGWGDSVVSKACGDASLRDADRQRLVWSYQYNSFIVFGPGIRPEDMQWESKSVLVHVPTKSRLTFKNDCFNIVFSEPGILAEFVPPVEAQPIRPAPVALKPQDIAALLLKTEQSVIDAYVSGKAPADVTIDVDRPTFDGLSRAADAHFSNGIGKLVRQSDQSLLLVFAATTGRGGVVIRTKN